MTVIPGRLGRRTLARTTLTYIVTWRRLLLTQPKAKVKSPIPPPKNKSCFLLGQLNVGSSWDERCLRFLLLLLQEVLQVGIYLLCLSRTGIGI